jgi:hypothetical protein
MRWTSYTATRFNHTGLLFYGNVYHTDKTEARQQLLQHINEVADAIRNSIEKYLVKW